MPKYRANVGMNFPDPTTGEDVRVEAGEPMPANFVPAPWLIEQKHVSVIEPFVAPPVVDAPHALTGEPVKE